ncbi:MAG TPA: choice-of-anchor D domain-containing protein, partial [Candidatus Kapabacteria bacterium]|nr:choice-of-anchor D domain-containing protein [Candidatus Kapabacteria bacterium]
MSTTFKSSFTFAFAACLLLFGSVAYGASFSLSPSGEIDFNAKAGATATKALTITNTTATPIYVTLSSSGSGASLFTTSSSTFLVPSYGSDSVNVSFIPVAAGFDTSRLTAKSSAGDSATATLVGHATAASFEITPEGTLVLNTQAGTTATDTLKLHNQTGSPISTTLGLSGSNASLFTLSSTSLNVAGGGTSDVMLNYTPLVAGTDSAMLTIISSAG